MEIDRIPFEGTNLFVVADDAGGQLDFVLAMFYQQTFRTLYNIADNLPGERFPVPVVSVIDEMLNMGNIPYKERILMTARSRNMPIVMGLQSMDLAKEKWGENILGALLDVYKRQRAEGAAPDAADDEVPLHRDNPRRDGSAGVGSREGHAVRRRGCGGEAARRMTN